LLAGESHRLLTPRVPVHRVVDVLEQVGAGFVPKVVGHAVPSFWGQRWSGQLGSTGQACALGCREQEV